MLPSSLNAGNKNEMGTRTYYSRRCKRIRRSVAIDIECIPEEVLLEILLRLPAQDIYFGARLVCRKWYNITRTKNFIHKHLEHASYGLLYRNASTKLVFSSAREHGVGIIDTYKINYNSPIRKTNWSCWNGLVLEYEFFSSDRIIYYVTNLSTHQVLRLPQYPYAAYTFLLSAIGYDAASMTYKVVVMSQESHKYGCAILTVGVDKSWRSIRTDHISERCKDMLLCYPITTEGFVHWKGSNYIGVLTLNLETEIMTKVLSPIREVVRPMEKTKYHFLSTGGYLSLFYQRGEMVWEFLVMNPGTGEWEKFPNICLEGQKGKLERLGINFEHDSSMRPCGWLKYPEVLILSVGWDQMIFYNCITSEVSVEISSTCLVYLHVSLLKNSLVWLGGS